MVFLAALCLGLAVALLLWPRSARAGGDLLAWTQLLQARSPGARLSRSRRQPMWVRLVPPGLAEWIRRLRQAGPDTHDPLARQLAYACLDDVITPEQFICLRVMVPLGLTGGLLLTYLLEQASFRLFLALAGGVVGAMLPDHWLSQQVKGRQEAIRRELPSVLTTLGVLLDAGLNLVPALQEVARRKDGGLTEVLRDALRQTALGTPVSDALQEAADRCGVQEFTLFVSVLNQAMSKGAGGISEAVRGQSRQIWALRQQQVQEKGQEMSQDLFFILLFLAFPAIALFLLGPVGLSLYQAFFK